MAIPDNPCFECKKRCIGCHSDCNEYRLYRAELNERNKIIKKAKNAERIMRDYRVDNKIGY
jgi:hypothetical protein